MKKMLFIVGVGLPILFTSCNKEKENLLPFMPFNGGNYKVIQKETLKVTPKGDTILSQFTYLDNYSEEVELVSNNNEVGSIFTYNGRSYTVTSYKEDQNSADWVHEVRATHGWWGDNVWQKYIADGEVVNFVLRKGRK